MILRRLAEGIKNQDWFVVFIELTRQSNNCGHCARKQTPNVRFWLLADLLENVCF